MDIIQYNGVHKFVGVLDNPPIHIPVLTLNPKSYSLCHFRERAGQTITINLLHHSKGSYVHLKDTQRFDLTYKLNSSLSLV